MNLHIVERLAQRRLSLHAAAKKAGIQEDRLRAVAEQGAEPSVAELRSIAKALGLPVAALLGPIQSDDMKMLFRKGDPFPVAETSPLEEAISFKLTQLSELADGLPGNFSWSEDFSGVERTPKNAVYFANRFRELLCPDDPFAPLHNLPQIVAQDLNVFVVLIDSREIEGASAVHRGHAYILLSRRTFRPRMLFTLAHELGHLIGRRLSDGEFATWDKPEDIGAWRKSQKAEEKFADAFSSALLVPEVPLKKLFRQFRNEQGHSGELSDVEILLAARFFGVSFEVCALRCEDLELLPPGGAHTLYDRIVSSHSNPERYASELRLPDREQTFFSVSPNLISAGMRKIEDQTVSIGRVAETLQVSVSDLINAHSLGGR